MTRARFGIAVASALIGLGMATFPTNAAILSLSFEREEFGGIVSGKVFADDSSLADNILDETEVTSWMVEWSGNTEVEAFSLSSDDGDILDVFSFDFTTVDFDLNADDADDSNIFILYSNLAGTNLAGTDFFGINDVFDVPGELCTTSCTGAWEFSSVLSESPNAPTSDITSTPEPASLLGLLTAGSLTAFSGVRRKQR